MNSANKILVSACLLGDPVRFDGQSKAIAHPLLALWQAQGRLVKLCPEIAGGLKTPRDAAEIHAGDGLAVLQGTAHVSTVNQKDLSVHFVSGAQKALELVLSQGIKLALLKANSPSCGNDKIYNGQFNDTKINGMGVTAALLTQHGIRVYNETQMRRLCDALAKLDHNANSH